jgi:hypothetical protein
VDFDMAFNLLLEESEKKTGHKPATTIVLDLIFEANVCSFVFSSG